MNISAANISKMVIDRANITVANKYEIAYLHLIFVHSQEQVKVIVISITNLSSMMRDEAHTTAINNDHL